MPKIPVNIAQLPTEFTILDESLVYHGVIRECKLSEETDKNGDWYLTGIQVEVLEPEEFRGKRAFSNYICIPDGAAAETDRGVVLGRFIKCFKVPYDAEGLDPADAIGCEGEFTAKTEKYQGRKSSRVNEFLI